MKKFLDEVISINEVAYTAIKKAYPNGVGEGGYRGILSTIRHQGGKFKRDIIKGYRFIGRAYGEECEQGQIILTAKVKEITIVDGALMIYPLVRLEDGNEYVCIDCLDCHQYCDKAPLCGQYAKTFTDMLVSELKKITE